MVTAPSGEAMSLHEFKGVGRWSVPGRSGGGLVEIEAEMDPERRALHQVRETEIAGGRRDGIAVEADECPHLAAPKGLGERGQGCRFELGRRRRESIDRRAEPIVNPHRKRLRSQRHRRADEDQATLRAGFQIPGRGGKELVRIGGKLRPRDWSAQFRGERGGHRFHDVRMRCNATIGRCARQGQSAFGRIEPGGGAIALAAISKRPGVRDLVGAGSQRIGAEGDKRIGVAQPRSQPQCFSIDRARRFAFLSLRRLVHVPAQIRERGLQFCDLVE